MPGRGLLGLCQIQEQTFEVEKKTTTGTVNEENSTLGFVSSVRYFGPILTPEQGYQGYEAQAYDETGYDTAHAQHKPQEFAQDRGQQRTVGVGGAFAKKRLLPSDASPHVIFLGLDPDFTEADVCRLSHP